MLRSMTGFGGSSAPFPGGGEITAEIRTVNARGLDVRLRLPDALANEALFVEEMIRARRRRGRVEAQLRLEGGGAVALGIDRARVIALYRQLASISEGLGLSDPLPFSAVLAVPGAIGGALERDSVRPPIERAVGAALDELDACACREGADLTRDFDARLVAVEQALEHIGERTAGLPDKIRKRIAVRAAEIAGPHLDPSSLTEARLDAEIAVLMERADVTEERTRLASHIEHFREVMRTATQPAGRKLDFVLQEMMREINTLGSKAQEADIGRAVVTVKSEIDRMREQVQNVE